METMAKATLVELEREIGLLRSFIIGLAGRDEEGKYRPEFVGRVFESLREKPKFSFKNASGFLAQLRKS